MVDYSRLIGADEMSTLARLKALRYDHVDPKIEEYRGRIVKTTGDGLLAQFASVVDAPAPENRLAFSCSRFLFMDVSLKGLESRHHLNID